MTRREIKFALHVEQVLNQINEPEYRQLIIESLALLGHCKKLLKIDDMQVCIVFFCNFLNQNLDRGSCIGMSDVMVIDIKNVFHSA